VGDEECDDACDGMECREVFWALNIIIIRARASAAGGLRTLSGAGELSLSWGFGGSDEGFVVVGTGVLGLARLSTCAVTLGSEDWE
jgi:hypothetical protein